MDQAGVGWLRKARAVLLRWAHLVFPLLLLFFVVWMRVAEWGWAEWIQHKAFDTLQALRPRAYEPVPVRVVDIDDETLARLGQWPWPRTLVARLVRRLQELGASAIAFDAVFAEPDRTSPARILSLWPDTPELQDLKGRTRRLPDHDQILARAIAEARVVTGFVLTGEPNEVFPLSKASFAFAGDGPLAYLDGYPGAVANLPAIERAASGNGGFGFLPERDGIIRRAPLLFRRGEALLPALAPEALRVAQGASGYSVKSSGASGETSFGAHTGISRVKIGSYVAPTDAKGRLWLYYTGSAPERTLPAWKVFERGFDRGRLEGAIAFVGTSAAGLKDLRATPLNPAAAGVEVHANVAEQILLGSFLRRPDWALGAEVLYMLLLGLGLLILLPRLGAAWCAPLALAGIGTALALSWHAFASWSYLLDPVFPCLAVLLVYMSSSLISYLKTEAEKRHVKGAFGRYMSPVLVEQLARHPEKLRLGGEFRSMTFHFCDIQGFTTISEFYDPQGLTRFLNRFLTPMTDILLKHKATIDKYIGDCIMAYWNAPLDDPEHAQNACLAVLEMHERLGGLNEEWRREAEAAGRKYHPIRLRTGLNTGDCIVGNMGSDQRFDYSVLGDDVNLASRLEGANKFFGTFIMASEATYGLARGVVEARELGRVRVVGKAVPIKVYNLLARRGELSEEWKLALPFYEKGLEHYYKRDFEQAILCFKEALKIFPEDGPSDLYLKTSQDYAAIPPAEDWEGVFNLSAK